MPLADSASALHPFGLETVDKFIRQPRLANACRSLNGDEARSAFIERFRPGGTESCKKRSPSDKGVPRLAARRRRVRIFPPSHAKSARFEFRRHRFRLKLRHLKKVFEAARRPARSQDAATA
ncbi:MAG: hypothetical protein AAFN79_20280 [Pseudomonadota bacterium]